MNDELRAIALALRDLLEVAGAHDASLTFEDGSVLTVGPGSITLVPAGGDRVEITALVEWTGLVPA